MHVCFLFLRAASLRVRQQRTLHLLSLFLAALPILLLAACGGGSSGPFTPQPNIQVAVWPATALVFTGQAMSFTATVTGSSNAGVIWMVQEGLSGGRVSNTGVYTAPASAGT